MRSRARSIAWPLITGWLLATAGVAWTVDLPSIGPAKGSLVIVGGGAVPRVIVERFAELAGGRDSHVVVIATADEGEPDLAAEEKLFQFQFGVSHVTVLHTRDRAIADS